jgi:dipeptidyl aminopeptidase/acylaminoacyl peptidase
LLDLLKEMSLELQVDAKTPPAFLWHTQADGGVPVENSILYAQALRKNRVPFELHIYQEGRHGLGLAPDDPHVATWMLLACQWLKLNGWPSGA